MAGGLLTDLYELNMAASYLRRGMTGPATFSLFVRRLPADRGFLIAAGLEDCRGQHSVSVHSDGLLLPLAPTGFHWPVAIAYFDLTPSHLARPRGRNTRHSEDYRHLDVSQCFGMCGGPSAGTFGPGPVPGGER